MVSLRVSGGVGNNICSGIDPNCRDWHHDLEEGVGLDNHSFRTLSDGRLGEYEVDDNWAYWYYDPPSSQ
jgi:hypothetical protein